MPRAKRQMTAPLQLLCQKYHLGRSLESLLENLAPRKPQSPLWQLPVDRLRMARRWEVHLQMKEPQPHWQQRRMIRGRLFHLINRNFLVGSVNIRRWVMMPPQLHIRNRLMYPTQNNHFSRRIRLANLVENQNGAYHAKKKSSVNQVPRGAIHLKHPNKKFHLAMFQRTMLLLLILAIFPMMNIDVYVWNVTCLECDMCPIMYTLLLYLPCFSLE
mmetsp:Transcript_2793/g.4367  ORF Transcript_2793/g.4367 Transcript_2793/m.4367 type:complete len:215 (-) Transcript_2793:65-709(-)